MQVGMNLSKQCIALMRTMVLQVSLSLEKYEKNYTSVGGFVIHGTYTENIDGKTYRLILVLNTILVLRKTKSIKRRMQK